MPIKQNQIEDAPKTLTEGTAPATSAGQGAFYTKDVGGVTEGFYVDDAGNEVQLTTQGVLKENITGANLGGSGSSVFSDKLGVQLRFRKIVAGTNVTVVEAANTITISASGGGGSSAFEKSMQNSNGSTLSPGTPVSKQADGTFKQADSDSVAGQQYCGILKITTINGAYGTVILPGANIVGAVTGLGFLPGDEVYLSETGGLTNDPNTFTGDNDSIIKVGIADCADGVASSTADDLIIFTEVVARP